MTLLARLSQLADSAWRQPASGATPPPPATWTARTPATSTATGFYGATYATPAPFSGIIVYVTVIGGGGGGGSATITQSAGGGGSGGIIVRSYLITTTLTYAITIGGGGDAGGSGGGGTGGTTNCGSLQATGGVGGGGAGGSGGAGGTPYGVPGSGYTGGILPGNYGYGSGGNGGRASATPAIRSGSKGGNGVVIISYPEGTATATGGTITSANGMVTHTFTTGGTFNLTTFNTSASGYVIAGDKGIIEFSPDSINWTVRQGASTGGFSNYDVEYINGYWIVCNNNKILLSPDTIHWTAGSIDANDISWNGSRYVVARSGINSLQYSTSLTGTWTNSGATNVAMQSVIWTGTQFVAVGYVGVIFTSPDGITWTRRTLPADTAVNIEVVIYGNGVYVIGNDSGHIFTSTDAVTWTQRTSPTTQSLYNAAWGNGKFILVGGGGVILRSVDNGVTWTQDVSGTTQYLGAVTFNPTNNTFLAVGGTTAPGVILIGS